MLYQKQRQVQTAKSLRKIANKFLQKKIVRITKKYLILIDQPGKEIHNNKNVAENK